MPLSGPLPLFSLWPLGSWGVIIIYMHLNGLIFSFPYFDNRVYLLKRLAEAQCGTVVLTANTWVVLHLGQKCLSYLYRHLCQDQHHEFDFLHHELTAYLSPWKNFLSPLVTQAT